MSRLLAMGRVVRLADKRAPEDWSVGDHEKQVDHRHLAGSTQRTKLSDVVIAQRRAADEH